MLVACRLEMWGICWNKAFIGAGLGGVLFLDCFVSGDVMPGLGFFTYSGGVLAGATAEHARFFSSVSISMALLGLVDFPPFSFKFGTGRIVGRCSIAVNSWVSVCCVPVIFPNCR